MSKYIEVSSFSYDVETYRLNNSLIPDNVLCNEINDIVDNKKYESKTLSQDLTYLDSFYSPIGVSGVAFKDESSGEVIIGFTGSNGATLLEGMKDWGNNLLGTGLGLYNHCEPAYHFYQLIRTKYGNNIVLTGHSQGGGIAQRVAIEYNVEKVIVYNAAPLYISGTNPSQKLKIDEKIEKYTGRVLRIQAQLDVLNNIADVVSGKYVGEELVLENTGWHLLPDFLKNKEALLELTAKESLYFLNQDLKDLDINQDGIIDVQSKYVAQFKSLFNDYSISKESKENIIINIEVLQNLSQNLKNRMEVEMSEILTLTKLCIERNHHLKNQFEIRNQRMKNKLKEKFSSIGFSKFLTYLNGSIGKLIQKESKYAYLSQSQRLKYYPNLYENRRPFQYGYYERKLYQFSQSILPLVQHIHQEKVSASQYWGEPTQVRVWERIDYATQQILSESEVVFKGEGNRSLKKDGIVEALEMVLNTIERNGLEIQKSLESSINYIQALAIHFKEKDEWIKKAIETGEWKEATTSSVPRNYEAYLKREEILVDRKDVIQALDRQVEKNAEYYYDSIRRRYEVSWNQLEQEFQRWDEEIKAIQRSMKEIEQTFDVLLQNKVSQKEEIWINGESFIQDVTSYVYWGRVENLYSYDFLSEVEQVKQEMEQYREGIRENRNQYRKLKEGMERLYPDLKTMIEEAIYDGLELKEIILAQKEVEKRVEKLKVEINYVIESIEEKQMKSKSIQQLKEKLEENRRLLNYYQQFIQECFGEQSRCSIEIDSQTKGFSFM